MSVVLWLWVANPTFFSDEWIDFGVQSQLKITPKEIALLNETCVTVWAGAQITWFGPSCNAPKNESRQEQLTESFFLRAWLQQVPHITKIWWPNWCCRGEAPLIHKSLESTTVSNTYSDWWHVGNQILSEIHLWCEVSLTDKIRL